MDLFMILCALALAAIIGLSAVVLAGSNFAVPATATACSSSDLIIASTATRNLATRKFATVNLYSVSATTTVAIASLLAKPSRIHGYYSLLITTAVSHYHADHLAAVFTNFASRLFAMHLLPSIDSIFATLARRPVAKLVFRFDFFISTHPGWLQAHGIATLSLAEYRNSRSAYFHGGLLHLRVSATAIVIFCSHATVCLYSITFTGTNIVFGISDDGSLYLINLIGCKPASSNLIAACPTTLLGNTFSSPAPRALTILSRSISAGSLGMAADLSRDLVPVRKSRSASMVAMYPINDELKISVESGEAVHSALSDTCNSVSSVAANTSARAFHLGPHEDTIERDIPSDMAVKSAFGEVDFPAPLAAAIDEPAKQQQQVAAQTTAADVKKPAQPALVKVDSGVKVDAATMPPAAATTTATKPGVLAAIIKPAPTVSVTGHDKSTIAVEFCGISHVPHKRSSAPVRLAKGILNRLGLRTSSAKAAAEPAQQSAVVGSKSNTLIHTIKSVKSVHHHHQQPRELASSRVSVKSVPSRVEHHTDAARFFPTRIQC
ncbi:hypothetical protein H9P43_005253 [Blastocladiella emersonii ATCC 22665]|nr:hypothetical protein H9P43_005240 [Blastocladiella emersonii ATCC 22665]KAI9179921.1 hypothetical protein H9P43_005253 [Blastocladiella emersonii ATCC 22665]